jgi:hypothetical protein
MDSGSVIASPSTDGRYVAFHASTVPGLLTPALVRKDRMTSALDVAAVDPGLLIIYYLAFDRCALSADGRVVAYTGQEPPPDDVLVTRVRDLDAADPVTVSVHLSGTLPLFDCTRPSISADGRWVVWESPDRRLVLEDTNGYSDIFVRGPLR